MLQNIREHAQGWIATVIGIMLSIAFALWGIEYYLSSSKTKDVAAKVNGIEITNRQLNFDFQRLSNHLIEQFGSQVVLNSTFQESIKKQALQNLITREVLIQAARHAGFLIGMPQISAAIQQIPEFQDQGQFSMDRFQNSLAHLGYSQSVFVDELRQTILLNQVTSGIIGSEFSLINEVDAAIEREGQRRDIFYAIVPATRFIKQITPSNTEITAYYQEHKNDFLVPAKVTLEYIELTMGDVKKSIRLTENEIKDYYQTSFNSNNKKTSYQKEKAKIVQTLLQQKMEQAFSAQHEKIADLAFTNPNSLEPIAHNMGLKIKTTEAFSQQGGSSPVTKNPKVITNAFNQEAINTRTNSNIIELAPGNIVVVRVKDYQAAATETLSAVENKIINILKLNSAKTQAQHYGEELVTEMKQQTNYVHYVKSKHLPAIIKNKVGRLEKNIPEPILQTAFSMPATVDSKPGITGIALANGDYAIVAVSRIIPFPTLEITQKAQNKYEKILSDGYGKFAYTLYLQNKLQDAKVKYY